MERLTGERHDIELDRDATVSHLRIQTGLLMDYSPDLIRLIFAGKQLSDFVGNTSTPKLISDYNIQKGSTIHAISTLRPVSTSLVGLPSLDDAIQSQARCKEKATTGNFDKDLHIVDPQSHYQLLNGLEQEVRSRSESFRAKKGNIVSTYMKKLDEILLQTDGISSSSRAIIREKFGQHGVSIFLYLLSSSPSRPVWSYLSNSGACIRVLI